MIHNFLLTTLRNLWKSRFFTFLNLLGLATGIASFLFITIYILDELSYDRFNEKVNRICRIGIQGNLGNTLIHQTYSSAPVGWTIKTEYPEVEQSVRLLNIGKPIIKADNKEYNDFTAIFCDSTLLDVFTFKLLEGDGRHVFDDPHSALISESMARKLYGKESPVNKNFAIKGWMEFRITGVYKDLPANSHFHSDMMLNFGNWDMVRSTNWWANNFQTYLLMKKGTSMKSLESKLPDFVKRHLFNSPDYHTQFVKNGNEWTFKLQPLSSIHLYSHMDGEHEPNGNITYIIIFSIAAIFILLIACINFMNLTMAKSTTRFREVGVRKVLGGNKFQILVQFMGESIILSIIAGFFALILIELFLPSFRQLTGKSTLLEINWPGLILLITGLSIVTGILAGILPSAYLSSLQTSSVFKGGLIKNGRGISIRSILVIVQFVISIYLIIGTIVVNDQLGYMINKNLGFDKDNILLIKRLGQYTDEQRKLLKQEISKNPGLIAASYSASIPMSGLPNWGVTPSDQQQQMITLNCIVSDPDFMSVYKLEIVKGRFFSQNIASDSTGIVLNEKAVKLLGWTDPIDKKMFFGREIPYHVIGVVRDYHYESLHQEIRPGAVLLKAPWGSETEILSMRISDKNIPSFLEQLQSEFGKISSTPLSYSFFNEDYLILYKNEQRTAQVMLIFAVLGIFIACLGLLGLSYFVTEQRTKEIGIRKVMGATALQMGLLLLSRFMIWIGIAGLVSIPLSFIVLNSWLGGFAYKINFPKWAFLFALTLVFGIAFLTVLFQSMKTAIKNPINSLRYE